MRRIVEILAVIVITITWPALTPAEDELEKIKSQLKSKKAPDRVAACRDAEKLGEKAAPLARELCNTMADKNTAVARAAASAVKTVQPKLHDPLMVLVLWEHGKIGRAVSQLAALKNDASPAIPILISSVSRLEAPPATSPSPGRILPPGTASTANVIAIVEACFVISPTDDALQPALVSWLSSKNPALKRAAIKAAGDYGKELPAARKKLMPGLLNALSEFPMRYEAISALVKFGPDAKAALPALRKLKFDNQEEMRKTAEKAIEAIDVKQ